MSIFYDRTEKPDEITIVYKSKSKLAWFFIMLIVFVIFPFPGLENHKGLEAVLLIIIFLILIGGIWEPDMEIRRAMKNGKVPVQVSGSQFSFSNPLTFIIKK